MSDDDFVSGSIKGIIQNGINLSLESIEEEQFYIEKIQEYFTDKTEFTAYLTKGGILEIEDDSFQIVSEIMVSNSTLYFLPLVNDIFDVFTELLKFIAYKHQEVVTEFRGYEKTKIQSIDDVNLKNDGNEYEEEEEESSSDDYEWI